jgi:hypothetical protein
MFALFRNRVTVVWLGLVAATGLSWESAHLDAADVRLLTSAVLVVAFVKVRYIGLEFMDLRHAPVALRFIFEAWVTVVCAALLVVYWLV